MQLEIWLAILKNVQDLESRFDHFDADSVTRYDSYLVLTHWNDNTWNVLRGI